MLRHFCSQKLLIFIGCWAVVGGCSTSETSIPDRAHVYDHEGVALGTTKAFVIDLGRIASESAQSKQLKLYNKTGHSIPINNFKASCECLSVEGLPINVPNGTSREVIVRIDHSTEEGFTGGLVITVELFSGQAVQGVVEVHCFVDSPKN
jgi:hypothetical protein